MVAELVQRCSAFLNRVVETITVWTLALLVLLVFTQVVTRYVLHVPLTFAQESSQLLWLWTAFLGVSVAYYHKGHIALEFLLDRLRSMPRRVATTLVTLVTLGFFYIVVVQGIEVVKGTMAQSFQTIPVSLGWEYAALPTGIAVSAVHVLAQWLQLLVRHEHQAETGKDARQGRETA